MKNKATWNDLVRRFWGDCTDNEAGALLWSCTAFPFASVRHTAKQLRDLRKKAGGDIQKAIDMSYASYEKEMKEVMHRKKAS